MGSEPGAGPRAASRCVSGTSPGGAQAPGVGRPVTPTCPSPRCVPGAGRPPGCCNAPRCGVTVPTAQRPKPRSERARLMHLLSGGLSLRKSQPKRPRPTLLTPTARWHGRTCRPLPPPPRHRGPCSLVPAGAPPGGAVAGLAGASGPLGPGWWVAPVLCPPGALREHRALSRGGRPGPRGDARCLSPKAAEPGGACSPASAGGRRGVGQGRGPPRLVTFEWHQARGGRSR